MEPSSAKINSIVLSWNNRDLTYTILSLYKNCQKSNTFFFFSLFISSKSLGIHKQCLNLVTLLHSNHSFITFFPSSLQSKFQTVKGRVSEKNHKDDMITNGLPGQYKSDTNKTYKQIRKGKTKFTTSTNPVK